MYYEGKNPEDRAACPVCRQVFVIPACGVQNLQNNFFINQLIQANEDIILHSAMRLRLTESYCDEHPDEQNRLYCYDCKVGACLLCFVEKHEKHYLTDANKSAEKFRKQLKEDVNKLAGVALQQQEKITQLEAKTKKLMDNIASTRSEIWQKYDQLISLIQSHQSQLIEDLNSFKDKKYINN